MGVSLLTLVSLSESRHLYDYDCPFAFTSVTMRVSNAALLSPAARNNSSCLHQLPFPYESSFPIQMANSDEVTSFSHRHDTAWDRNCLHGDSFAWKMVFSIMYCSHFQKLWSCLLCEWDVTDKCRLCGGIWGGELFPFSSDPIAGVPVQSPYHSRDQLPLSSNSSSPGIILSLGTSSYSRKRVAFAPSVYEALFPFLLGFQQCGSNLLRLICIYYWSYFCPFVFVIRIFHHYY